MEKKVRVLVADDHDMMLLGITTALDSEGSFDVVGAVSNGEEVMDAYREHQPEVVLLDYRMPGISGDRIAEELIAFDPKAQVLMFTSYEWEEDIWRAVIAGARGFLPKSTHIDEICQGIAHVAKGGCCFPRRILAKLELRERREQLTSREFEVLECLGEGLCNKEISARLELSAGTVRTHVSRVLGKLQVQDRTQAVISALKRGLLTLDEK